jgi:hypothetical protein
MQQTSICTNCGAEIPSEARFCRNCGQRSTQINPGSVIEGTTRLLETPERPAASFDQNVYDQPGGLAQPTTRISPQANPTNRDLETNPQPSHRVMISLMLAATVVLILAGLFIALRNRAATTAPSAPVVTRPDVPPIQPPPPPPPLPSPVTTQGGGISPALVYPGAKTLMQVTDASEGNVLQLETSDSLDKVVAWYTDRLKPTQVIRAPGSNVGEADSNVILVAGEMKVIINAQGDRTIIMLAQGGD